MESTNISDMDALRLSDREAIEEAIIRIYILEHFTT